MTVYITAIHPADATRHEQITTVRWLNSIDSTSNTMLLKQAIEWLRSGNHLTVAGDKQSARVQVVNATPPYIRTVADGTYTDNLLSLPRY